MSEFEQLPKAERDEIRRRVETQGIYRKFTVRRNDGRDAPGEKHDGCRYFVLDLNHDPHAIPALKAYAKSCRDEHPSLSSDVRILAIDMEIAAEGKDPGRRSVLRREWPNPDAAARGALDESEAGS